MNILDIRQKGERWMTTDPKRSVSVYLSYAQKDEALKEEFTDYLAIMQQAGLVSGWVERQVQRGTDWSQIIDPQLLSADFLILLVSPTLLASGYCSGAEVRAAFEMSSKGEACVMPIILHHVNLTETLLETIQSANGLPISSWPDRSEAWRSIDGAIRDVIKGILRNY